MLKKRIPTPKTGAKGRAYELCHLAWRAGLVKRWHLMEDGTWSIEFPGGDGRIDGLTVESCAYLVEHVLEREGFDLRWGPCWLGYREIVVTRVASEVAA